MAQDTLLNVFESFDQLREPERVRPWVFRIARNACLMKRRKSVFAPSQELSLDDFVPAIDHQGGHAKLQIADWSGLPDRLILQSEMKRVLDQAISALPENYKSVILMRDIEELSTLETAQSSISRRMWSRRGCIARVWPFAKSWTNTCGPVAAFYPVRRKENEMELHER